MLDLLSLQPHQVSNDLRGYSVMFYGEAKSGKTTTASKFPKSLIIAFEKGYAALPGVMAIPVNSWTDFLKILRQLKDPAVKEKFETIIIDTVDIAYDYCEQFICSQAEVDSIADIPFGGGYSKLSKEFDSKLRSIVQQDFGVVLISHSTDKVFKDENGIEYNKIITTLPAKARLIASRMCDIIGYSRSVNTDTGTKTMLFLRGTERYEAGSRFKYTPDAIEFNHDNLVNAIQGAVKRQAQEDQVESSQIKDNINTKNLTALDFEDLLLQFNNIAARLASANSEKNIPKITDIVEKYLGIGKKVNDMSKGQADLLDMILYDLKELK
jgi:hypothetical protein